MSSLLLRTSRNKYIEWVANFFERRFNKTMHGKGSQDFFMTLTHCHCFEHYCSLIMITVVLAKATVHQGCIHIWHYPQMEGKNNFWLFLKAYFGWQGEGWCSKNWKIRLRSFLNGPQRIVCMAWIAMPPWHRRKLMITPHIISVSKVNIKDRLVEGLRSLNPTTKYKKYEEVYCCKISLI